MEARAPAVKWYSLIVFLCRLPQPGEGACRAVNVFCNADIGVGAVRAQNDVGKLLVRHLPDSVSVCHCFPFSMFSFSDSSDILALGKEVLHMDEYYDKLYEIENVDEVNELITDMHWDLISYAPGHKPDGSAYYLYLLGHRTLEEDFIKHL